MKLGTGVKQLAGLLDYFSKDSALFYKHSPSLQTLAAAVQAIRESTKWDELLSIEKVLLLEDTSLLSRIKEVATKLSVKDIVVMCCLAYSLVGDKGFDWRDERAIQEVIAKSISFSEGNDLRSFPSENEYDFAFDWSKVIVQRLLDVVPTDHVSWLGSSHESLMEYHRNPQEEEERKQLQFELKDKVNDLFNRLKSIGTARSSLQDYK